MLKSTESQQACITLPLLLKFAPKRTYIARCLFFSRCCRPFSVFLPRLHQILVPWPPLAWFPAPTPTQRRRPLSMEVSAYDGPSGSRHGYRLNRRLSRSCRPRSGRGTGRYKQSTLHSASRSSFRRRLYRRGAPGNLPPWLLFQR